MINPVIHVIPLTSKKAKYNLNLGDLLYDEEEINKLKNLLINETDVKKIKEINNCIKYYSNRKDKKSYACIKHLKTISKLSVCKLMNEYDYLYNLRISSDKLKLIDEEIIKEYTLQYKNYKNSTYFMLDQHKIILQNIDTRAEMLFIVLYKIMQYDDKCRQTFYKGQSIANLFYFKLQLTSESRNNFDSRKTKSLQKNGGKIIINGSLYEI